MKFELPRVGLTVAGVARNVYRIVKYRLRDNVLLKLLKLLLSCKW